MRPPQVATLLEHYWSRLLSSNDVDNLISAPEQNSSSLDVNHPDRSSLCSFFFERSAEFSLTTVLHLGFPKSGSTTLQKNVFCNLPSINYMGTVPDLNVGRDYQSVSSYHYDEELRGVHRAIFSSLTTEAEIEEIALLLKSKRKRLNLLSNEFFLASFFSELTIQEKIARASRLAPAARILVIIRAQHQQILSQYRDHPFEPSIDFTGRSIGLSRWIRQFFSQDEKLGYVRSLDYLSVWNELCELFPGKVVFLPLEGIQHNLNQFSRQLAAMLEQDPALICKLLKQPSQNIGVTKHHNVIRKLARNYYVAERVHNQLTRGCFSQTYLRWLSSGNKASYRLNASDMQLIRNRYSTANSILSMKIGWDLQKLGYL